MVPSATQKAATKETSPLISLFSLYLTSFYQTFVPQMARKDDGLVLSLGLSSPPPSATTPFPTHFFTSPLRNNKEALQASSGISFYFLRNRDRNVETRPMFQGIDVNRAVTVINCDEEMMVSSPNSTVSILSGKRSDREENDSVEVDDDAAARKKLRLSKEQAAALEEMFKEHSTLNPKQKAAFAKQLNLRPRQVEVWFQNRRARTKLKQTEVDCEYLRRCCENLTEENHRLQKEAAELRALKLSPQFYMNSSPPTTLTMCPHCERVSAVSSSSNRAAFNP